MNALPVSGKYSCQPAYGPHLFLITIDFTFGVGAPDEYSDDANAFDDVDAFDVAGATLDSVLLRGINNETVGCRGPLLRLFD